MPVTFSPLTPGRQTIPAYVSSLAVRLIRPLSLAVAGMVGLVACSSGAPDKPAIGGPSPATAVPDCASGQPIVDQPVFAVGVSAEGRVCWETALTRPLENSHTSSAPLISDGAALLDADGHVFAVDLSDGHLRWRWDSGAPVDTSGDAGGNATIAAADGLVVATQGAAAADVVGLDDQSGGVRWRRAKPAGYVVAATDTGDQGVVFSGYDGPDVEVINDRDGSIRWRTGETLPSPPPGPSAAAVFDPPTPVAGQLIQITPQGAITAVSSATGEVSWRYPAKTNEVAAAADVLLLTPPPGPPSRYDVQTTAVNPTTGHPLWSIGPLDPGGSEFSEESGAFLHTESVPSGGTLTRLDPATGRTLWSVATQTYATGGAGGLVDDVETTGYQTGTESVVSRNPSTGAAVWRTPVPLSPILATRLYTLQSVAGPVLVLVQAHTLTGLDPQSGAHEWQVTLPADTTMDGLATAAGGLVVQLSGAIYAIQGH
jgi:outer membrane protein assembly factor BamB